MPQFLSPMNLSVAFFNHIIIHTWILVFIHNFVHNILKGLAGGSLSGKSSLVHRYLAGYCPKDEVLSGRHKKCITIDGQKYLLLVRDETGPPDAQVC